MVGRDDTVRLEGREAACVESVSLRAGPGGGAGDPLVWKADQPDELAVTVPLAGAGPGPVTLLVKQYGMAEPQTVSLQVVRRGRTAAELHPARRRHHRGARRRRLDQVTGLTLAGVAFKPGIMTSEHGGDELALDMVDADDVAKLAAGQIADGEGGAGGRPRAEPEGDHRRSQPQRRPDRQERAARRTGAQVAIPIRLTAPDDLRQGAVMTFSVRARQPARFSGRETIEVAAADGEAPRASPSRAASRSRTPQVAVATLDTGKAFNGSAFGPLRYRIVTDDGAGDWQPLATLVRVPTLRELKCDQGPDAALRAHRLEPVPASNSVASDPGFSHAVRPPDGFPGYALSVPHPVRGRLYILVPLQK